MLWNMMLRDCHALIRPSNIQPVLVVRFEAETEKDLEEIMNEFKEKLCIDILK